MRKNITDQVIGAQLIDASDGSAFSGATVTVHITGDGGTQAAGAVGSGACTDEGNGFFSYVTNAAETNKDHLAFTFTATGAIPVTVQVYTRLDTLATSIDSDITDVLADTAELQVDWEDGGRLDVILDSVLQDTGTTIPATIATIDTEVGAIDTVVDLILEDTSTTIPATIATIDTEVGAIDTVVDLILLDTAELQGDWEDGGRLDVILDGAGGGSGLDAAGVRDAVGLDSANLDTQLTAIVGDTAELQGDDVPALIAAVQSAVNAIKTVTDLLPASGALTDLSVNLTKILGTALAETTGGRMAANQNNFWDNSDSATTKIVDNVGAIASGGDATEAKQNTLIALFDSGIATIRSAVITGGEIILKTGDEHITAIGHQIDLTVEDATEAIYDELTAAGVLSLTAGFRRVDGDAAASEIAGTITKGNVSKAAGVTTIPIEVTGAATVDLLPGEFEYDVQYTTSAGDYSPITGPARLERDNALTGVS